LGSATPDTVPEYRWAIAGIPYPVGDLNGDGYDDLVSSAGNGTILVRFGGATLDSTVDAVLNFVPYNVPDHFFSGGDLNHDGYNDLLCLDQSDEPNGSWVTVHLGGSTLNPQPAFTLDWRDPPFNWVPFWTAASLGDMNGDGVDDFMVTAVEGVGLHRGVAVIYGGRSAGVRNPSILPPSSFSLSVFPNPFNSSTVISFSLPHTSEVDLRIYDVTGRMVRTMAQGKMSAGEHELRLEAGALPSGVYFVKVEAGKAAKVAKFALLR